MTEPGHDPTQPADLAERIAAALLDIGGVGFRLTAPITFKSGILSPVYCDNRTFPFHPAKWREVIAGFRSVLTAGRIPCDVLAGLETAGIPHSAALGYAASLPSVFVRKQAKEHGTRSRIEGGDVRGRQVVLVEDLVTTGGSSLSGVEALREAGAEVADCLAIVSYGFTEATEAFNRAGVRLHTLTNFPAILHLAEERSLLTPAGVASVQNWLANPRNWKA
jgi:orotate phosphoribosyltransferase